MKLLIISAVVLGCLLGGVVQAKPAGLSVQQDGKSVWPPKGPGCDALVKCCDAFKNDSTVTLGCQLGVTANANDCKAASKTIKQMIQELGHKLPKECQ